MRKKDERKKNGRKEKEKESEIPIHICGYATK